MTKLSGKHSARIISGEIFPIKGRHYTRKKIVEMHGGNPQKYLPYDSGRVVCACIRTDLNPEAPRVILPGRGPEIEKYAEVLCKQGGSIPVYIKRASKEWEFVGDFEVISFSQISEDIARYEKQTGRAVTRVIYMKEVQLG